jgi:3-methyladenine DNA glycosylase AlkC
MKKRSDVPAAVLEELNAGTRETNGLVEGLCVDFAQLMSAIEPSLAAEAARELTFETGIAQRMARAGGLLHARFGLGAYERFAGHASDTVRGWAGYVLAADATLVLRERLKRIRALAEDSHFGVREWAWMAVRPAIAAELPAAIRLLVPWSEKGRESARRFASESTRPRGVWCAHLDSLKQNPEPARPLLEPLKSDPAKYVRDSVGNWLNDAAKSQPGWVRAVTARWTRESKTPETAYIVKRALRSFK